MGILDIIIVLLIVGWLGGLPSTLAGFNSFTSGCCSYYFSGTAFRFVTAFESKDGQVLTGICEKIDN